MVTLVAVRSGRGWQAVVRLGGRELEATPGRPGRLSEAPTRSSAAHDLQLGSVLAVVGDLEEEAEGGAVAGRVSRCSSSRRSWILGTAFIVGSGHLEVL